MPAVMFRDGELNLGIQYSHGHDQWRKARYRFAKPCFTGLIHLGVVYAWALHGAVRKTFAKGSERKLQKKHIDTMIQKMEKILKVFY